MADYTYKARDARGNLKTGRITATSEDHAAEVLAEHKLILVKLSEKTAGGFDINNLLKFLNRVSLKDKVVFTGQLGTMIKSGLPIVQALHILADQTNSKYFASIIRDMATQIEGGSSFSSALMKYQKHFDKVYVNLVRSGEASGRLEETLQRLATQQEKNYTLIKKVRGAMMYPAFVLVAMVAATIVMLVVVIPPLKAIFADAGAQLPLPTRVLIFLSDAMRSYWYAFLMGGVGAVFGLRYFLHTPAGRNGWDNLKLRVPIFGPLFRKIYTARFTRTLSSLVSGGVPILQALDIVSDSIGNSVYEKAVKSAAKQVESGAPLSVPIRSNPIWPAMVPQMINVGEQTGKMDQVLDKLAEFFEEEVDNTVKNLSTLLEPLLMVVMGIGVGGLLVAILMPIYNLGNVIN